ncbi:hypothetical protein HPB48_001594 [Haemaphysalis longicornis]|uniref:Uncharacterized protein n=1 Tax=Haemaphysalis longicornis TaxID=44386 RepID=A0A9J6GAG5_HAELO|nr:hypothetical protein HPB48_001594 [Haemaphysalis longicornis]
MERRNILCEDSKIFPHLSAKKSALQKIEITARLVFQNEPLRIVTADEYFDISIILLSWTAPVKYATKRYT